MPGRAVLALAALLAAATPARGDAAEVASWPYTGGDAGGARYSPLAEIDRGNVARLELAWSYRHGDYRRGGLLPDWRLSATAFEASPLVVEGRLYFPTPFNRVIALDAATGEELWSFDPEVDRALRSLNMWISRGVAWWRGDGDGPCSRRIFLGTLDARLIALDAESGRPCPDFGSGGSIDLRLDIAPLVDPWEYNVTSPPMVVGDVVVVGSSIGDLVRRRMPPGDVRAFDARSGRLLWRFHTIPREGGLGVETWRDGSWREAGGANVWTTMSADLERGLVFLPVSSAGPDHYGGERPGQNLFSEALVAVAAASGERVWHFQTVHHDLWDYDLAAPPNLVRVDRDGRPVEAVAQATKHGFVFLLERSTGKPLFPVEERRVPASDVPGEEAWPTQPFPARPPPLVPQRLAEEDLWAADPARHARCRAWLRELRNDGLFTPPSQRGSIVYPHTAGGANWSGAAFDPERQTLFVPVNNAAHVIRLVRVPGPPAEGPGGSVLRSRLRLAWWFFTGRGTDLRWHVRKQLFAEADVPCNRPPWGSLVAVDLARGEIRWSVPTDAEPGGAEGLRNLGPPLATAGGLVFHGGTRAGILRAHDADSGRVLARFELPAGLHAGPISYRLEPGGPQYLVVAAGGHRYLDSQLGDWVIAYRLPRELRQGAEAVSGDR